MVRRRFTTEEAWEKVDDAQGLIVDLLGRFDYFSQADIAHLGKAYNELNQVMGTLNTKITKKKR